MVSWVVKVFEETMNKRPRRVERGQRVGDVGAIDIGDEMGAELGGSEGRQSAGGHGRAEVGAADADIDDIGEASPRAPQSRLRALRSAKAAIFARTASTAGMTFSPSTRTGSPEKLRKAMWRAARPSV